MRTLFLHIGHGKTGTTWVQSSLRLSRSALAAHGIDYPHGADGGAEDPLRVTSGNGFGLLDSADALEAALARAKPGQSALFSNEDLFNHLHDGDGEAFLGPVARRLGFERVELLLFVRDPLGHAASRWIQWVKDRGLTEPMEAHFAAFDVPERVARVLERLARVEGVGVGVRNYSRCGDRLLDEVAAWLGLPPDALAAPPAEQVNRSLTGAELALQLGLNARLGPCPRLVAYPLIERLPDIRPEPLRPDRAVQQATWDRLLPSIERVNARLPAGHHYRCDLREGPAPTESFVFSPAQVDVIADAFAAEALRLRARGATSVDVVRPRALAAALARRLLRAVRRRLGAAGDAARLRRPVTRGLRQ